MKTTLLVLLLLVQYFTFGQNRSYLLNAALPVYANPAFTGSGEFPRLNYGFSGQNFRDPNTTSLEHYISYDRHIKAINSGAGLEVYNRSFSNGAIRTSSAALNYAYQHAFTSNLTLSVGGGLYYKNQFTDFDKIPDFPNNNTESTFTANYFDYKLGAVFYTNAYFLSVDAGRFNYGGSFGGEKIGQNTLGFEVGQIIRLMKSQDFALIPTLSYFVTENRQLLSLQLVARLKNFFVGGRGTIGQNFTLVAGYNLGPIHLKLATSINTNKVTNGSREQFDVVLQYNFRNGRAKNSRGFVIVSKNKDKVNRRSNAFKFNLF